MGRLALGRPGGPGGSAGPVPPLPRPRPLNNGTVIQFPGPLTLTLRHRACYDRGMKNAAMGYVRVSTGEQVMYGVSLDAQAQAIETYAARKGLQLLGIESDEGVSGTREHRPGLDRVRAALRSGAVQHVIAWQLDRIGRALWALDSIEGWAGRGIGVHLVGEGDGPIDGATAAGRLNLGVRVIVARHQRDQISERTRLALAYKAGRGERVGALPYGYALDADGVHLRPIPAEQAVLREIEAQRAAGQGWREIADRLNARGVAPKRTVRWTYWGVRSVASRTARRKGSADAAAA